MPAQDHPPPPIEMADYNGQSAQDLFVLTCLKGKRNGVFVELGSNDPIVINNTWPLERDYDWTGLMVEYDRAWAPKYISTRPKSHAILDDATRIDYVAEFASLGFPRDIDYLQIDLEPSNGSTINTLEKFHTTVMDNYRFATVTFEHDIYTGDHFDTRQRSREIFAKRGYIRVFSDVMNRSCPYEDWYIHPELVDSSIWKPLLRAGSMEYIEIVNIIRARNNTR